MTYPNGAAPAPEKKDYRTCGPLAWEPVEGGVRIAELLVDPASLTVPREIEGRPVVELGMGCFSGKNLEQITLPDTLKKIGPMAFGGCQRLTALTLPDSVEVLGSHMIRDTAITRFTLPRGVKALPTSVFSYCKGLRTVELHDDLRSIGPHAFYMTLVGCEEPLVLPGSLEKIEAGAFFTPIGSIRIKTDLPVDPFWFSDLPAPLSPAPERTPSMITSGTRSSILKVLREAVGQLAPQAAEARLFYQMGLITQQETRNKTGSAYMDALGQLRDVLNTLCREKGLRWNEEEFRYLNEVLLLSAGLGYHVNSSGGIVVGLLEDVEGDPALQIRMDGLVRGAYGLPRR